MDFSIGCASRSACGAAGAHTWRNGPTGEKNAMTAQAINHVYYDPWDVELNADPYPMFKRSREEAPLYYNAVHDFYAVNRYDDVNQTLVDNRTFSSAKGNVLEILKSGMEIPPGHPYLRGPPIHDIHRNLLSRAFTPRKIKELESKIRELTVSCLDERVTEGQFDFVKDLGAIMPLRVVGMLFGIPEDFQKRVIEDGELHVRTEPGKRMTDNPDGAITDGQVFADFIDWRVCEPCRRSHYRTSGSGVRG